MIATYVLLCLTVVATLTDVSRQKIYNWTTYSGIAVAFLLSGFQTLLGSDVFSGIGRAFLGLESVIETLLWTFVIGGAMALVILIWKMGLIKLFKRVMHQLMCRLGVGVWDELSLDEKKQLTLPLYLAPAAFLALLIVKFKAVELVSQAI